MNRRPSARSVIGALMVLAAATLAIAGVLASAMPTPTYGYDRSQAVSDLTSSTAAKGVNEQGVGGSGVSSRRGPHGYDDSSNLARASARLDAGLHAPRSVADDLVGAACSFSGTTTVVMADGTRKAIADIEIGDDVLAEDPETGERGPRRVTRVWEHEDTVLDLEIDGDLVTTTEDHPFWNATDGEWQEAKDLDAGDLVRSADGELVQVGGLRLRTARTTTAFNLTVDGIHTYFVGVGEDDVLVHNTCGMLGAHGTQVTSRTLTPGNRPYRIDVENPAPGRRPGQLHLQDDAGGKYLYDFDANAFVGLPRSLQRQIANDPAVARAIAAGRRYLGME